MPSFEKSEIKKGAVNEVGNLLDDQVEEAEKRILRMEGAREAFVISAKDIEALTKEVDQLVEDEKIDIQTASLVKTTLVKGIAKLRQRSVDTKKAIVINEGQLKGLKDAVAITKKVYDSEHEKGQAALEEEKKREEEREALEAERQEKEAKEAANEPGEAPQEEPTPEEPEAEAKPQPKRKPRDKKPKANGTRSSRGRRARAKANAADAG